MQIPQRPPQHWFLLCSQICVVQMRPLPVIKCDHPYSSKSSKKSRWSPVASCCKATEQLLSSYQCSYDQRGWPMQLQLLQLLFPSLTLFWLSWHPPALEISPQPWQLSEIHYFFSASSSSWHVDPRRRNYIVKCCSFRKRKLMMTDVNKKVG